MSRSWSRTTRYFVLALMLIGLAWFAVAARALLGTLAISAVLAYILNPAVTYVNRRARLARHWVVVLVYLISLAGLIAAAIVLVPIVPEQVATLVTDLRGIYSQFSATLPDPISIIGIQIPLATILPAVPTFSVGLVQPGALLDTLQAATTNIGWLLVILVTTYYLLQDWPSLREWLFALVPDYYESDIRQLYAEVAGVWNRYFRGQLRLMFIVGLLTGLASAAIGLPGAVAFGLLAGLFDILLSVGPAIVMIVAMAVALFAGSTFLALTNIWFALLVMVVFGTIQFLENIWLRPRIMANSLRMHPAVVFVSVIGSLALAGVLVALIIIPLLGSAAVFGRYVHTKILDVEPRAMAVVEEAGQATEVEEEEKRADGGEAAAQADLLRAGVTVQTESTASSEFPHHSS